MSTPDDQLGQFLNQAMGQMGAMASMAMEPDRREYRVVPWPEVNTLAADGWEMIPVPAMTLTPENWRELGYDSANAHAPAWTMCRKLGPADAAAALLEERAGAGG